MTYPTSPPGDQRTVRDGGPASSATTMTSTTVYKPGRALLINCTVAGTVTVTFADATTFAVALPAAGVYEFNWAVITVTTGTATATYANLY